MNTRRLEFTYLKDICLDLSLNGSAVENDLRARNTCLLVITGANRGGKTIFLRSIGQAQRMMQCGMFVAAQSFQSSLCDGFFTHFKREEDASMERGKLDEELSRMDAIVRGLTRNPMLLLNESFSATNVREGSEIASQIITAFLEKKVRVFFVTHLIEFASACYVKKLRNAVFLRAERKPDGERTFRVLPGKPLETSFGDDVYRAVFKDSLLSSD